MLLKHITLNLFFLNIKVKDCYNLNKNRNNRSKDLVKNKRKPRILRSKMIFQNVSISIETIFVKNNNNSAIKALLSIGSQYQSYQWYLTVYLNVKCINKQFDTIDTLILTLRVPANTNYTSMQ